MTVYLAWYYENSRGGGSDTKLIDVYATVAAAKAGIEANWRQWLDGASEAIKLFPQGTHQGELINRREDVKAAMWSGGQFRPQGYWNLYWYIEAREVRP